MPEKLILFQFERDNQTPSFPKLTRVDMRASGSLSSETEHERGTAEARAAMKAQMKARFDAMGPRESLFLELSINDPAALADTQATLADLKSIIREHKMKPSRRHKRAQR